MRAGFVTECELRDAVMLVGLLAGIGGFALGVLFALWAHPG